MILAYKIEWLYGPVGQFLNLVNWDPVIVKGVKEKEIIGYAKDKTKSKYIVLILRSPGSFDLALKYFTSLKIDLNKYQWTDKQNMTALSYIIIF